MARMYTFCCKNHPAYRHFSSQKVLTIEEKEEDNPQEVAQLIQHAIPIGKINILKSFIKTTRSG